MSKSSNLSRLERAADMVEIRNILTRYCHGIDRRDFDVVLSCYHADATKDHGDYRGITACEFYPIVQSEFSDDLTAFHITNMSVEFADEDTALVEAYYFAIVRPGDGTIDTFMSGRYIDRFERRNNQWRIAHRVTTSDWWALVPRNQLHIPGGLEEKFIKGTRGLDDPYFSAHAAIFGSRHHRTGESA